MSELDKKNHKVEPKNEEKEKLTETVGDKTEPGMAEKVGSKPKQEKTVEDSGSKPKQEKTAEEAGSKPKNVAGGSKSKKKVAAESQPKQGKRTESSKKQTGKTERSAKRGGIGKKIAIVMASILGILVLAYVGMGVYFSSHFVFHTEINGTDYSMSSASAVEADMKAKVDNYVLILRESDGTTEEIQGTDIGVSYKSENEVATLLERQNNWMWITSLWNTNEIETNIGVTYDDEALEKTIQSLNCMSEEGKVVSENARPVYKDGKFVVQPEVVGTQLNADKFQEQVAKAIDGFRSELDLKAAGCYDDPKYTSDSKEVKEAVDTMNNYLKAEVTYDFSPHTEVVDASRISDWLSVDEDMQVTLNEAAVGDYVMELANKYNTIGTTRTITSGSGAAVSVSGGAFGWQIDQESETALLLENIKNGETVSREPEYYSRGKTHEDGNDIGTTFAEVDLTNQVMYYIKDGQVAMKADVVTGNPNTNHGTPAGVHFVLYKESPSVLRGDRQVTGEYEWETEVQFWMPFTSDGCGFHDATWQPTFGGDRYLTNGSHGCVNMSYNEAEQLYNMIQTGDPVIVHN